MSFLPQLKLWCFLTLLLCFGYIYGLRLQASYIQPKRSHTRKFSSNHNHQRQTQFINTPHLGNNRQIKPYTCYEPIQGLREPVVTVVTTAGGAYEKEVLEAIINNRLSYTMPNGYRYCEMTEKADVNRDWSWQRFPITLALLPCTDFLVYMDADALFVNPAYDFGIFHQLMDTEDIDILLSRDYFSNSPVQFGVFMVRSVPWIYTMFEELYNLCVCEWRRMTDWPREQGMIYDYLRYKMWVDPKFAKDNRTRIISPSGWNDQANQVTPKLDIKRFIQHYAGCCYNLTKKEFEYEKRWNLTLDNIKEFNFHTYVYPHNEIIKKQNFCKKVYSKNLMFQSTYKVYPYKSTNQSVLNLQLAENGEFEAIEMNQIVCSHGPSPLCKLPFFWNAKQEREMNRTELDAIYLDVDRLLSSIIV